MKLSVIIVNYNVEHFLEQCLNSVLVATEKVSTEVIVVDNNSVDGSLKMLHEKFPQITLIDNHDNLGFSKANNQGIKISKGEYVLLLNPDTIVEEDTFKLAVDFMDLHPEAGGLGVKMLDGKGRFLPESKRGLPTPAAAFYKMFGLSKIFPKSKRFAAYHQGHLNADETHEVEVLSGAFMLMRKKALDEVGLLDEDFFMYGEDIDLSFRLIKGGYKNYYFPKTRIIHYKGESTKKNSVNYVYVFYNAMVIFAKKHYSTENAKLFSFLINTAIIFRAFITIIATTIRRLIVPVIDFSFIYGGMILSSTYWGNYILGANQKYPDLFLYLFIPLIILFWQLVTYYTGGYDKPIRIIKIIGGQLLGTMMVLVVYALLPESIRFSRALILFGAFWSLAIMLIWRMMAYIIGFKSFKFGSTLAKRIAIIGSKEESQRVFDLVKKTSIDTSYVTKITTETNTKSKDELLLGSISQLDEIVKIHKISEIIFCAKSFTAAQIIDQMSNLKSAHLEFKIAPPELMFIIGSNSINTSSDIYFVEMNAINKQANKRFKRLLDFIISTLLIVTYPFHFYLFKNPIRYFKNIVMVFISAYTFVGFDSNLNEVHLPALKNSILQPSNLIKGEILTDEVLKLNLIYARNYKLSNDLSIVLKAFRKLDKKVN